MFDWIARIVDFGFLGNCSCIALISYVHVAMRHPPAVIPAEAGIQ